MIEFILRQFSSGMIKFLTRPLRKFQPISTNGPDLLKRALQPGDVLLVEGNSRVSSAIKYLTQSTWSHAALYVGPIAGRETPEGEPHVLVEAELGFGVISTPLSLHAEEHTRICRPVHLDDEDRARLIRFVIQRIGDSYDAKNVIDLMRYLLPTPPVPIRFRRRMIALGSGEPTRTICSTLIAQAFQSVHYPILPDVERLFADGLDEHEKGTVKEIHHIRHHSLYTPRDFDVSPFFEIVKPTIEAGFDYKAVEWVEPVY
ncbi:MAG: YiiX/YebB-like N1pC/P60 family cysteine hydrolase [Beijerinckiaceae bacterium]